MGNKNFKNFKKKKKINRVISYNHKYKDRERRRFIKKNERKFSFFSRRNTYRFNAKIPLFITSNLEFSQKIELVKEISYSTSTNFLAKYKPSDKKPEKKIVIKAYEPYSFSECEKIENEKNLKETINEIDRIIQSIYNFKHKHFIDCYGYYLRLETLPWKLMIYLEYCENGNLDNLIDEMQYKRRKSLEFEEKIRIIGEICSVMKYLHVEKKVIHGGLKTSCILLNKENSVRILMKRKGLRRVCNEYIRTNIYLSPEEYYGNKVFSSDVFSFSIIMFMLLENTCSPFGNNSPSSRLRVCHDPDFRPIFQNEKIYPKELVDIIKQSWSSKPEQRPSFSELNRFFRKPIETIRFKSKSLRKYCDILVLTCE